MATGYRVTTETGTVEFTEHDKAIAYHAEHGIGEIEPFEIQAPAWDGVKWIESGAFDIDAFVEQLSVSFDAKFETYWKAKGYFDLHDLNNHSVDTQSKYHTEALSLIRWANNAWEAAIADIDEQSNIQEIINSLQVYE